MTPYDELMARIAAVGSQHKVASELGIAGSYMSLIVNKKAPISERMARKLGYVKTWVPVAAFKKIGED